MALNKSRSPFWCFFATAMYIRFMHMYLIYIYIQTYINVRYIEAMLLFEIVYFFFYEHHFQKGLGHGLSVRLNVIK